MNPDVLLQRFNDVVHSGNTKRAGRGIQPTSLDVQNPASNYMYQRHVTLTHVDVQEHNYSVFQYLLYYADSTRIYSQWHFPCNSVMKIVYGVVNSGGKFDFCVLIVNQCL